MGNDTSKRSIHSQRHYRRRVVETKNRNAYTMRVRCSTSREICKPLRLNGHTKEAGRQDPPRHGLLGHPDRLHSFAHWRQMRAQQHQRSQLGTSEAGGIRILAFRRRHHWRGRRATTDTSPRWRHEEPWLRRVLKQLLFGDRARVEKTFTFGRSQNLTILTHTLLNSDSKNLPHGSLSRQNARESAGG